MAAVLFQNFLGMRPWESLPARNTPRYCRDVDLSRGTLAPFRRDRYFWPIPSRVNSLFVDDKKLLSSSGCIDVVRVSVPCVRYYRTGATQFIEAAESLDGPWWILGGPPNVVPPFITQIDTNPWLYAPFQGPVEWAPWYGRVCARQFLYTYVDRWGNETGGSLPSNQFMGAWDAVVRVSNFTRPDARYGITHYRLYASEPDKGDYSATAAPEVNFFHVADIPIDVGTYDFSAAYEEVGHGYDQEDTEAPPQFVHSLQGFGTQMVALTEDGDVLFSEPHEPHNWPASSRIRPDDRALRLVATEQFVYVLTNNHPHVIDSRIGGGNNRAKSVTVIDEVMPLIAPLSASQYGDGVVYISTHGIVFLQGSQVKIITAGVIDRDFWEKMQPWTMCGVAHNGFYYFGNDAGGYRVRLPGNLNAPVNDVMFTALSIRPTAFHVDSANRLFYADSEGIKEFGTSDQWRDMRVVLATNRRARRVPFTWASVETDTDRSLVLSAEGQYRYGERLVRPDKATPIPPGAADSIVLRGTSEVARVILGTSLDEVVTVRAQ